MGPSALKPEDPHYRGRPQLDRRPQSPGYGPVVSLAPEDPVSRIALAGTAHFCYTTIDQRTRATRRVSALFTQIPAASLISATPNLEGLDLRYLLAFDKLKRHSRVSSIRNYKTRIAFCLLYAERLRRESERAQNSCLRTTCFPNCY